MFLNPYMKDTKCLRSESFVQFDDIHIINCLAGTFQSLWYSIDWSKTHHCSITACNTEGYHLCNWFDTKFFCYVSSH